MIRPTYKINEVVHDISLKRSDRIIKINIEITKDSIVILYKLEMHTGWVSSTEIKKIEPIQYAENCII